MAKIWNENGPNWVMGEQCDKDYEKAKAEGTLTDSRIYKNKGVYSKYKENKNEKS